MRCKHEQLSCAYCGMAWREVNSWIGAFNKQHKLQEAKLKRPKKTEKSSQEIYIIVTTLRWMK